MNIQRLKFAWARGARLEFLNTTVVFSVSGWWPYAKCNSTLDELLCMPHLKWRIHPNDAHLEYGPISSVLRQDRTNRSLFASGAALIMVSHLAFDECQFVVENKSNEDLITLVRLFYAELLADEGL